MNSQDRNFTDADLEVLAELMSTMVVKKVENKLFMNIGVGFMKYVWAGVFGILLYLAAAGYKGH